MINTYIFEFFHELRDPVERADVAQVQRRFAFYLDLWTKAEARSYDGIFFSEHHFGAAYSPSPNLLVAAMAARTTRIRLGVLGSVTPYSTPWRMVEEFAMLDQLTNGRFEAGFVSGIPPELAAAGFDAAQAAQRHNEVVEVLQQAVAGPTISLHGTHWSFDALRLVPPFVQSPLPVWTAAKSDASAERAGRAGWKLCGGFLATADLAKMFDRFRTGASDAGHSFDASRLGVRRLVRFVDSPNDRAAGLLATKRTLLTTLLESVGPLPPWASVLDRPDAADGGVSDDEFVTGTTAEVAEQLIEQCRATGAANLLVTFSPTDPSELADHHERFAREVLPKLHTAATPTRA
jgi:alkanesulfonate monooxygenase SsuD/methylene tetrahydromethanopterin reductase-like flavin-dependent oxidoreductase (luciferase family)